MKESESVDYLIEGYWEVEDDQESHENFKNILTPLSSIALHEVVCHFNYDCSMNIFSMILDHSLLDKSSLLAVYWRLAPGYYQQYESKEQLSTYEVDNFTLLERVHKKLQCSEKLDSSLIFNPKNDKGVDWTIEYEEQMRSLFLKGKKPFYSIPEEFYNAV